MNGKSLGNEVLLKSKFIPISSYPNVKILQNELNTFLGEDAGIKEDGKFGRNTKKAVEGVQDYFGIPRTGQYDEQTMALMERGLHERSKGNEATYLPTLGTLKYLPSHISKVDIIDEMNGWGKSGNNFTGRYYITESGDVYTKGSNGYNQVAYLPEDRTGGIRYLDSMFEGTPLEFAEYLNVPNALRKIGTKATGEVIDQIKKYLGKDAKLKTNKSGDIVIISKDGNRKIRFDIKNPSPHKNPHGHVEEKVNGKWKKSGPIYPTDIVPE
jgi:hypothetical protein